MALIVAFVTITALTILGLMFRQRESDKGWRDQDENLQERTEQERFYRA
jgi:hypothetical protein